MQTRHCRECRHEQPRYWDGSTQGPRKHKIYKDESGRRWNGYQCPSCKYAPKNSAAPDGKGLLGESLDLDPLTPRKCRKCRAFLRASRYFNCSGCTVGDGVGDQSGYYSPEDWGYSFNGQIL